MYDKSNGLTTKRDYKRFSSMLSIRRRIVSLMLVGSLPLLLGATCGLETCDIFNCDTLPFIEELLAPDEHAEDMHDDMMDGMTDEDDEHDDGMEDVHDDEDEHMNGEDGVHEDDDEDMADEEGMHDGEGDHDEAVDEPDEGLLQDEEQDEHGDEDAEHNEGAEER